ncbi:MAG: hypothetical protein HY207_06285 [Nitrospirae bacterium]|nr:hypothetical protein [Nitrospirota bacterium]
MNVSRSAAAFFVAIGIAGVADLGFCQPPTVEERLDRLIARADTITIGVGALQIQYYHDSGAQLGDGTPIGSGTPFGRNGVTIRRAELYARGRVTERITYETLFDVGGSGPIIRDGFIEIAGAPYANLRLGQFRIPFGVETRLSNHNLVFIDRMLATYLGEQQRVVSNLLQEWDRGVQIGGEPISGPLNVSYALALINGEGLNPVVGNGLTDVVGRFGIRVAGYQIGASTYRGTRRDAAAPFLDRNRTRFGWDAEINPNPLKALLIRGEFIRGRDDQTTTRGWYVLAAYRVTDCWEPAVRVERWDPDRGAAGDGFTRTTLGLNYDVGGTRLSADYEFRDDRAHPALGNLSLIQYQLSF